MSKKINQWSKSQKAELEFHRRNSRKGTHIAREMRERWIRRLEKYPDKIEFEYFNGKDILEVGCGPNGIVHYIPGHWKVGVDPLIEEYKKLNILKDGGVEHIVGAGERLDFDKEAFDIIICFNVLDHCQDPAQVCQEMSRVLKRGGSRIIFHSHCITPLIKPLRSLLKYFDKPHPWHLTAKEMKGMFCQANLKEEFGRISIFHGQARSIIRQLAAKLIIRDYLAVYKK